jgi:WD40 repeat protein
MGGLVVKQAYVIARRDPSFADLAKRMEAMIFLATPHRGSNLAKTLNDILRVSGVLAPRAYISNLDSQNEILSQLNDAFRHYAADVSLYSFYESRPTKLHVHSEIIVAKDSAVLGYHNERHSMLDADHRHVCKFESPSDPNYTAVCGALRSVTGTILDRLLVENAQETRRAMRQIENFLAMPPRPEDDLSDVEEARIEGSCEWLAANIPFQRWADPDSEDGSAVYWISANPGTGKSVLSGYVINALTGMSLNGSYYFFRYGDNVKSTVGGFLRSLCYQLALRSAEVRQQLLELMDQGARIGKDDTKTAWRQLRPVVCNARTPTTTQYWVLDALDECSDFDYLFSVMASIERHARIRILITNRKLPEIAQKFAGLRKNPKSPFSISVHEISLEDTKADIHLYLDENRDKFHVGDDEQKDAFRDRLLRKSEGSFLWARTVLDELEDAWSVSQVECILDEVPPGMDLLYSRALAIMSSRPKRSRDLARAILTWIVCSVRPLTVVELGSALKLDVDDQVPELEKAVASLCAQLVHIDKAGRAMVVHLTARAFLTSDDLESKFHVDEKLGHARLATSCLKFLCSEEMKLPPGRRPTRKQPATDARPPFAGYACLEFAEHLRHAAPGNAPLNSLLHKFLGANVLSWIEYVATAGDLSVLTRAADSLKAYLQRHIQSSSPLDSVFLNLAQNWVVDLHRVVTGFGPVLLESPWGIYWLIPPFCPKSSAIAAAAASRFGQITVKGFRDMGWNDCVSRIHTPEGARSAACGDTVFAVGSEAGTVTLYHDSTCMPWKTLGHGSEVCHLSFDRLTTHLVSAGKRSIKVWEVDTGLLCWAAELEHDIVGLHMTEDGQTVMAAEKSHTLTSWSMRSGEVERTVCWREKVSFPSPEIETGPLTTALSPDASLLAVAYEDRPVFLYGLEDDVGRELVHRSNDSRKSHLTPASLVFNTQRGNPTVVVAYRIGGMCLFDYKLLELRASVKMGIACVACSPDGLTVAAWAEFPTRIQLREFNTLRLMYQVNVGFCFPHQLCFRGDNMRLVWACWEECSVWEPAVLLRVARRRESSSEPAECEAAMEKDDTLSLRITSVELDDSGSGQYFFFGRGDGSVSVCSTAAPEQPSVLYRHRDNTRVRVLAWGPQKRIIASSVGGGKFIFVELSPDPELGWKAPAPPRRENVADSRLVQLLLDPSNDLLLVTTGKSNTVWNLNTRKMVSEEAWPLPLPFRWINHPGSPTQRTLMMGTAAATFDWESSDGSVGKPTTLLGPAENWTPGNIWDTNRAFSFAQEKLLVFEIRPTVRTFKTRTVIFDVAPRDPDAGVLTPAPSRLAERGGAIKNAIGGYGSRLVFLDTRDWVSSVEASELGSTSYLRHFPLPPEWLRRVYNPLMLVTRNGDVLFVREDQVAVISGGLEIGERVEVEGD